jgi:hypothetical protein
MKAFVMLFLLAVCIAPSIAGAQVTLFSDDFNNGARPEWVIPSGGWVAENGHMTVTSSCGFQSCNPNLYAGSSLQSSYLVSFDFMVTTAYTYHGAGVGCWIALSNPVEPDEGITSGYSLGFGWSPDGAQANANCQIQRWDNSVTTPLVDTASANFWIVPGVVYHVKLGRIGAELVAKKWADGQSEPNWQVSVTDATYTSGYWMPIFWNNVGWIDNFAVVGFGAVPTESASWGSVKSLFR